ncbi:MAG: hypothetical protein E7537_01035 [Ruminococcaceae bacterium]|nr:hypothetical protein [Oscillospiraceae bacterium]
MKNKVLTLLGFASKAGKLQFGMAKSQESVRKEKSQLLICANDVSQKSKKEIAFMAHNKDLNWVTLQGVTIEELSAAVGRKCGIVSVNDNGFAKAISKVLGGYANDQQI